MVVLWGGAVSYEQGTPVTPKPTPRTFNPPAAQEAQQVPQPGHQVLEEAPAHVPVVSRANGAQRAEQWLQRHPGPRPGRARLGARSPGAGYALVEGGGDEGRRGGGDGGGDGGGAGS
jgi:hypothetical protein